MRGQGRFILICDPGPDPDDVKALLVLAALDLQRELEFAGVVTNGGANAQGRAALARCLLDHIGATHVPVGIGSAGTTARVGSHEFSLTGYDSVERSRLEDGRSLLRRLLVEARPRSLTLVCISALTDFKELACEHPELVLAKVREVAIQGGLERVDGLSASAEPLPTGADDWRPDSSTNNLFDLPSAAYVYRFCMARGLPMAVVGRHAVPMIPMQLARSFAVRTSCPIMSYLAAAQFKGLEALWLRLCAGELPPRCDKQWYFETFCAVPPEQFRARRLESLEADAPIIQHLCGYVKPYDIVALMEVLPVTRNLAPSVALRVPVAHADSSRRPSAGGGAVVHRLRLGAAQAVDARFVERLLRATYHEVVLATAAVAAAGEKRRRAASRRSSSAAAVFPTRARGGGEDGMAAARPASSSHATATTQGPPSAQLSPLRALTRAQPSSLPLAPATGRGIGRALSSSFSASPLAAARSEQTSPAINSSLRGRLACATQLPCDERQSRASSAHVTAEERHSGASRTDALSTRVAAASSSRHSAAASTGGGGGGGGARSSRSPAHSRASATRGAAPWTHGEGSACALASGSSAAAVDGDGLSGRAQAARSSGAGGQQAGSGVGLAEAVGSPLCVQRSPNLSSAVRWLASRISRASSFADSPRVGDWGASSLMGAAQLRAERLSAAHTALANALAAAHARNARTTMAALFIGCVSFGSAVVLLFVQALSLRGSAAAAGGGSALTSAELIDLYALGTVPLWNGVLHVLYCTGLQTVAIALHPIDSARGRRVTRAAGHFVLLVISCNVALNAYALHLFLPGAAARQLGTPGPPLLTFLVVHVNVVVAIAWLYLLGALCGRWRTGGALATTIGHACTVALWGNFFPFAICYWALAISPRSIPVSVAPWDRNMTIAAALSTLALVLTLACADTTARLRVHALLGRAMSAEGEQAALGALVGFGSAHQRPARDLIEEASKLFVPIELTPDALERIAQALDHSPARKRRPPTGASPPRRSSCDWPCPWRGGGAGGRGRRRPLDGAWQQGDELATRRMASEGDGSIARGYGHRWRDWTGVGGSSAGRATHSSSGRASMAEPGIADAYVVHSSADPPALRARLLAEWAAAFAQREGRPAVVWLDCACADPGLEAHELLAHMPCYLALCTQLLVLGGPTLTEQLLCVAQLFAWRAMGMPLERVVVLPFGNGANAQPPHEQAIAALDAFHVMYAVSAPKGVRKRIVRMIGLATVATVNEVVQAYAVAVVKPPPSL